MKRQRTSKKLHTPADFARSNGSAAVVVLANPGTHGGEAAGLVRWARMVIAPKSEHLPQGSTS